MQVKGRVSSKSAFGNVVSCGGGGPFCNPVIAPQSSGEVWLLDYERYTCFSVPPTSLAGTGWPEWAAVGYFSSLRQFYSGNKRLSPRSSLIKIEMFWYISKWFISSSLCWKHEWVFSITRCEGQKGSLDVELNKVWGTVPPKMCSPQSSYLSELSTLRLKQPISSSSVFPLLALSFGLLSLVMMGRVEFLACFLLIRIKQ